MIHFRFKAQDENKNESTIRHEKQNATNENANTFILIEIWQSEVIKEPTITIVVLYCYSITSAPIRTNLTFELGNENRAGTTIGPGEHSRTNAILRSFVLLEIWRSEVIKEASILVLVYNSVDINGSPMWRCCILRDRHEILQVSTIWHAQQNLISVKFYIWILVEIQTSKVIKEALTILWYYY